MRKLDRQWWKQCMRILKIFPYATLCDEVRAKLIWEYLNELVNKQLFHCIGGKFFVLRDVEVLSFGSLEDHVSQA